MQKIQFTSGCPNNCSYCHEPNEVKCYNPVISIDEPKQILDMNFLANPNAKEILKKIPACSYEFVCGVDYRLLDQEVCDLMKEKGFIKVRWAWDYNFGQQRIHQKVWRMFKKAGYRSEDLSVFMLVNWKIPYSVCVDKLNLLKIWGVKVNDCCFDGGYSRAKPTFWTPEQIKKFRKMCRKHNQMIRFKIDPEYK